MNKDNLFIDLYLLFIILIVFGGVFLTIYLNEQESKNIETTYDTVTVTIVETKLNERSFVHPLHRNRYEAQKYEVVVKYNGINYSFYGKDLYDKYQGEKTTKAILKTVKYKSGDIKNQRIISLGETYIIK